MIFIDCLIFVCGLSCFGGMFVCIFFDVYFDVVFFYEFYLNFFEVEEVDVSVLVFFVFVNEIECLKNVQDVVLIFWFGIFVICMVCGGFEKVDFVQLIWQFVEEGGDFGVFDGWFCFIEFCVVVKMCCEGKMWWGMKCNSCYDEYFSCWFQVCFFNVLCDGCDVFVSQFNIGSFNKMLVEVGWGWMWIYCGFEKFWCCEDVCVYVVCYEVLIIDFENEFKVFCNVVGLIFDISMLSYIDFDLMIFKVKYLL